VFLVWKCWQVYRLKLTEALIGTLVFMLRNTTPSSTLTQNYKTIKNSNKLKMYNHIATKCKKKQTLHDNWWSFVAKITMHNNTYCTNNETKKLKHRNALLTWTKIFRAQILVCICFTKCRLQAIWHVLPSTVNGIQAPVVNQWPSKKQKIAIVSLLKQVNNIAQNNHFSKKIANS